MYTISTSKKINTVTVQEMKEIERKADSEGLSYYQMMENAGTASYNYILDNYPDTNSLFIFCGKGNNGGDGLVVARLAANDNKKVYVILVEGMPVTTDAITNFTKLPDNVEVIYLNSSIHIFADKDMNINNGINRNIDSNINSSTNSSIDNNANNSSDIKETILNSNNPVIVDAIYGTGFHGNLREDGKVACDLINHFGGLHNPNKYVFNSSILADSNYSTPIISLDIPSGLNADTKEACEGAVIADATIVFHAYKNVHSPATYNCGKCVLVSIGIS